MNAALSTLTDPSGHLALWAQMARIGFESQAVIAMRMAGMIGLVPQSADESIRMVTEKHEAACESVQAVLLTAGKGASPQRVLAAALLPYGLRTSANSARLSRRH